MHILQCLETPVSNTGGNSEYNPLCIDTLSMTGKIDQFPSNISVSDDDVINEFSSKIQFALGITPSAESAGGMNGYLNSLKLEYTDDRPFQNLGYIAWGGNAGTYQLYLTGEACEYIHMINAWKKVHDLAESSQLRIKRIDIALDDFEGKLDIDLAMELYKAGEFQITRNPKIRQIGNFIDPNEPDGRTIYIGCRDNGKMMRIYEKGKQLNDPTSPWVRWELELKAVDRIIPLDALLDPAKYYAGSYPALSNFRVSMASEVIKTVRKIGKMRLDKMVEYASTAYGKLFNVLHGMKTPEEIVEMMIKEGVPKRLRIPIPHKSKPITRLVTLQTFLPKTQLDYDMSLIH